jgi:hypothetical protein
MTNKLVVIINSLKYQKLRNVYSCLQKPWLGGYRPKIPVFSVLKWICWTPPPPNKIPGYATGSNTEFWSSLTLIKRRLQTHWIHGNRSFTYATYIRSGVLTHSLNKPPVNNTSICCLITFLHTSTKATVYLACENAKSGRIATRSVEWSSFTSHNHLPCLGCNSST